MFKTLSLRNKIKYISQGTFLIISWGIHELLHIIAIGLLWPWISNVKVIDFKCNFERVKLTLSYRSTSTIAAIIVGIAPLIQRFILIILSIYYLFSYPLLSILFTIYLIEYWDMIGLSEIDVDSIEVNLNR
jgi:hypothetical protein